MSPIKSLVELGPRVILLCQLMCIFPDVRKLWLCVGCPGQPGLSAIDLLPQQRIPKDRASLHIRVMSELRATARFSFHFCFGHGSRQTVSHRVDVRVGAL